MRIKGNTKVVGLFGYPVNHSLSPLFQNAAFAELGLNFAYFPFLVRPKDLSRAVEAIRTLNLVGVNVTVPHKEKIVNYLDETSPEVKKIGAVNTVVNQKGRLIGYNTDGEGFINSLKEKRFNPRGKRVLLLGAGGAAVSIGFSLLREKAKKVVLINRTYPRAINLSNRLKRIFPNSFLGVIEFEDRNSFPGREDIDLLINATPVGMRSGDSLLINIKGFSSKVFVYDIVYNQPTKLLKEAKKRNLSHLNGLEMLISQGALSFELWTGRKAPIDKMRKALKKAVKREE
ncbi:shikimate dehydrogenase [Patescibacteria group bacterium]|nr:shikimate dehydrogenase [Patescibacteria group bacterium]